MGLLCDRYRYIMSVREQSGHRVRAEIRYREKRRPCMHINECEDATDAPPGPVANGERTGATGEAGGGACGAATSAPPCSTASPTGRPTATSRSGAWKRRAAGPGDRAPARCTPP